MGSNYYRYYLGGTVKSYEYDTGAGGRDRGEGREMGGRAERWGGGHKTGGGGGRGRGAGGGRGDYSSSPVLTRRWCTHLPLSLSGRRDYRNRCVRISRLRLSTSGELQDKEHADGVEVEVEVALVSCLFDGGFVPPGQFATIYRLVCEDTLVGLRRYVSRFCEDVLAGLKSCILVNLRRCVFILFLFFILRRTGKIMHTLTTLTYFHTLHVSI